MKSLGIVLNNNRYLVKLLVKELRERLAKDEIMLTQYNQIIQSQLGDGIKRLLNHMSLNEIFLL